LKARPSSFTQKKKGHLLNISSLLAFWTSCIELSDFKFWGTLLAVYLWVVWLDCNQRVFSSSSYSRAVTVYFLIFQLFQFWTGSSINLEHILVAEVEPEVIPPAATTTHTFVPAESSEVPLGLVVVPYLRLMRTSN
jgi:hypothetical protein